MPSGTPVKDLYCCITNWSPALFNHPFCTAMTHGMTLVAVAITADCRGCYRPPSSSKQRAVWLAADQLNIMRSREFQEGQLPANVLMRLMRQTLPCDRSKCTEMCSYRQRTCVDTRSNAPCPKETEKRQGR